MKLLSQCQLYTFVDTAFLQGRSPELIAEQLCAGGSDLIQLRAKQSAPLEVRRLAERIWPIVQSAGVGLVINDYPAIAASVGAPLCHLGQEDFFDAGYSHVRQVLASSSEAAPSAAPLQIGLSTHSPVQAQRALAARADYIAIGPVFATGTKPGALPVTLEYVRWAANNVQVPWFAIGGINLQNLESVLAAGARRVCVVSAILLADDVVGACQKFKDRLLSAGLDRPARP